MTNKTIFTHILADEDATKKMASKMEGYLKEGDLVALVGDLGAGKSVFARAFIRARMENFDMDVPSPTFTLVQIYDPVMNNKPSVWHADLYRLEDPEEVYELDFEDGMGNATLLVEWPDRLPAEMTEDCLILRITIAQEGKRQIECIGSEKWAERLSGMVQ